MSMRVPIREVAETAFLVRREAASVIRMAVDPMRRHPLDGRLDVRRAALVPLRPVGKRTLPSPAARRIVNAPAAMPSPRSVLVVGDSLSITLASALERRFAKAPRIRFAKLGKVSSGLARPDFFDWDANFERLVRRHRPDTVVVMIAANDNKTMHTPAGRAVFFPRRDWKAEYRRRVRNLAAAARRRNPGARLFWVGAPVMADPGLNRDVGVVNAVVAETLAGEENAWFVETKQILADGEGRYARRVAAPSGRRVTVRAGDGVHLTRAGGELLADACLKAMEARVDLAALAEKPLVVSER